MNRAFILSIFLITMAGLTACQSVTPFYNPPAPQIAKAPPNTISNDTLEIPPSPIERAAQEQVKKELPPIKIGILLPLTGKHSNLGQSMLKAAQMALFDLGHSNFELVPRDTKGNPETAKTAAREALNNGAQIILGPVFASAAKAVRPIVQSANVNMFTFSTDWTIASHHAYVMGFSPFDQVERVLSFAKSRGMHNIAALTPASAYGDAVLSAYRSSVLQNQINSVDSKRISPNAGDVSTEIRSFAQYDARKNESQKTVAIVGNNQIASRPQPANPYDAIFMPLGGNMARSVSNLLSQYDLAPSQVKRLGTGLWDDPSLATEAAMEGAWFASPDPRAGDKFRTKFEGIYGYVPPRLTTLAYDATALAGVLARKGFTTTGRPAFNHAAISNPNGFAGIDGIFRFNSTGVVERGLAILEYKRGQIQVIDKAPATFVKAQGYPPASGTNGNGNFKF